MSTLRCATLALVSALASEPAIALEGFSACHDAGTTVTSILISSFILEMTVVTNPGAGSWVKLVAKSKQP